MLSDNKSLEDAFRPLNIPKNPQTITYLHIRTVAIIERLCKKEEEELVRTKADSKGPGQSMVRGS
jgi:hypothetical protein